jgi:hypothetical protein
MFPKIRSGHLEEREIAIVRDELHRGWVLIRITLALDRKIAAVAHHVGAGEDALAVDYEPGADAAPDRARVPRRTIIGFHLGRGDPDEAALDMAVWLSMRLGDEEKRKRADEKWEAVHQEKSGKIKQKRDGVKRQSKD